MTFVQIIGVAVCAALVTGIVRHLGGGSAVYVTIGCSVVLTYFALKYFQPLAELFFRISDLQGIGTYAGIIMKLSAIGTITCIASDICSDMGENAVSSKIELVGKGAACMTIVPVLEDLLYSVMDFLM